MNVIASCPSLPLELWQAIFEQAHTLRDAVAWQHATGVRATSGDFRRLLARRAPSVLLAIPEPKASTLWPGPTGPAPHRPPGQPHWMRLCGPVFFAPKRFAPSAQALSQLFDAAVFMFGFAPASPVTEQLLSFATTAWMSNRLRGTPMPTFGLHTHQDAAAQLFEGRIPGSWAHMQTQWPPLPS